MVLQAVISTMRSHLTELGNVIAVQCVIHATNYFLGVHLRELSMMVTSNQNYQAYFILIKELDRYYINSRSYDLLEYPCVHPTLPNGLSINITTDGKLYLTGTPKELSTQTQYSLKIKAPLENIISMSFNISVVDNEQIYNTAFISSPSIVTFIFIANLIL